MAISLELKKRTVTAVIGALGLVSLIVFVGWLGVFVLATLISLGMVFEFSEITFSMPDRTKKKYVLLLLGLLAALIHAFAIYSEFHLLIFSFISLFIYYLLTANRHDEAQFLRHFKELMYSVFGLIYTVFMPFYFIRIYEFENGAAWTILFLLIVWSGDTGAYFVGKKYGRQKLYPKISPNKTSEGAAGGLIAGVLVTVLFKVLFFRVLPWFGAIILPVVVGAASQMGDFCESFFKRAFDRKDSGSLLPGHGGVLDRFDGVVFGLPVMYICMRLFG